mgnify:CR=1 FL=1
MHNMAYYLIMYMMVASSVGCMMATSPSISAINVSLVGWTPLKHKDILDGMFFQYNDGGRFLKFKPYLGCYVTTLVVVNQYFAPFFSGFSPSEPKVYPSHHTT